MDRQAHQERVASRVVIRVNLARMVRRRGRVVVTPHQAVLVHQLNEEHLTVRIRMITSHTIPPSQTSLPSQLTPSHHMIVLNTPSLRIASRAIVKIHIPSHLIRSHRILSHRIPNHHTPSHHILRIHTIPRMQGGANQNGDRPQALRHGLREVGNQGRAVEDQAHHGRAVERQGIRTLRRR